MMEILGNVGPAKHTRGGQVVIKGYYGDGSLALSIEGDQGPEATITVCLAPEGPTPPEGHVWLKGWSENEGIPEALESAGLLKRTGETYPTGHAVAELAEIINPIT